MSSKNDSAKKFGRTSFFLGMTLLLVLLTGNSLYTCTANTFQGIAQEMLEKQKSYYRDTDGSWIVDEQSKPIVPEVPSATKVTFFHGRKAGKIVTNCKNLLDKDIFVEPGESIQVRHASFHREHLRNRCSFNAVGDALPINGADRDQYGVAKSPGGFNVVAREQFFMALPFPYLDWKGKTVAAVGGEMIFTLCDPENCALEVMPDAAISFEYIERVGGMATLKNTSGKRLKFDVFLNYMTHFQTDPKGNDIGRDGSTATFAFTIFKSDAKQPG